MAEEESFETSVVSDVESLLQRTINEKDNLIRRQLKEIKDLKRELDIVFSERDMLLCEVSKLKFELEMAGLKKLQEGRPFQPNSVALRYIRSAQV